MPSYADTLAAARALATQSDAWFWLDGSAAPSGEQRVSYLGRAGDIIVAEPGREHEFLEALRSEAPQAALTAQGAVTAQADRQHRFNSGWVVALGYEFGVGLLGLATAADDAPPACALRVDEVLALHHDEPNDSAEEAPPLRRAPVQLGADPTPLWRSDDEAYLRQVTECRQAIHRGDAYVLCLTDTAEIESVSPREPLGLYEALSMGRSAEAATRGGVISIPGRSLVSASPERFLSVNGRTIATHPIKGTRRRGVTHEEDAMLADELAHDPKERAENLMIVDLMRNDLSRVCAAGSVRVDRFLDVETHPRVHQLVSTVVGELATGCDVFDAIAACFPGGSMTGAPKQSAIANLARLESGPRGLYSGCFGWIDDSGDAELAMTIRGIELRVDPHGSMTRALVGAGGGVTADSMPERELAERNLKAAGMLAALARA